MRIHFLLTQDLDSPSGLGRYLPLAQGLQALGHHVEISTLHSDLATLNDRHPYINGVPVHYVAPMHVRKTGNTKHYFSSAQLTYIVAQSTLALTRRALTTPADIVHVGKPHPMNSIAGLMATGLNRTKLAVDCDDYEAGSNHYSIGISGSVQRWAVTSFEDWVPRRATLVTTNTYFTRDRLISLGVAPERIVYLPNGVDRQRFLLSAQINADLAELRRRWDIENCPVVVYIGSMSLANHPVDLLLRAFVKVRQVIPNALLLMVGGGQSFDQLATMAGQLGIGESVRFTGRVAAAAVPDYYRLGHVSIDPVHDDHTARGRSPLKLFESWAAGVPFVTADVGDRRALLGHPPAGILVESGNPNALAQGIIQVLADPDMAQTIAQRGIKRVLSFHWNRLAADLSQIYEQIV